MDGDTLRHANPVVGFVASSLLACSSTDAPTPYLSDPGLRASPDGGEAGSGCRAVESAYSDAGCRADWSCSDAGLLELVCAPNATQTTCACLVNEQTVSTASTDGGACSNGTASQVAASVCGWAVP
jgi:hypothetical protein